jgi:hypothetical protein
LPRRAPTQVVEQRHTLGTFERAQLSQLVQGELRQQQIATIAKGAEAAVKVAAACGMGWLALETYRIVNPPDDEYVNPTGGNLWAALRYRSGVINRETYDAEVGAANAKAKENAEKQGKSPGGFLDWVLFGNDGKFFFFG